MNIVLTISILVFGTIGIVLNNYWELQLEKFIQKQTRIKTSINAVDILNDLFGNGVKIIKIDKTKGIGADYYNSIKDEFFLTEDTDKYNSASVTIAYFLGLLKFMSKKPSNVLALYNIGKLILNSVFIILLLISFFSANVLYLYASICIYLILILNEILSNVIHLQITGLFITRYFKKFNDSISNDNLNALKKYASIRWLQIVTMLLFKPLLVSYYYLYYFIKK
jgi:hypothetical protein